jgi:replicative DNA helicase
VIVSGKQDILRFSSRVGAVGHYKSIALDHILAFLDERKANTNRDVIPRQAWKQLVVPAMSEAGVTARELHKGLDMSYSGSSLYRANLSRERASRVASIVASPELNQLATNDLYWDRIDTITVDTVEEVFDLTVPGPHNFVADGILVHNSIEQDADMVMFLYRPEYYKITEDEQGNSLAGIAEVIVGKNRHGEAKDIRLRFESDFARFSNLDDDSFDMLPPGVITSGATAAGPYGGGTLPSKMNADEDDIPF